MITRKYQERIYKLYYKIKNGLIIIIYFDNEFIGRISYNINNYEIKILGETK